MAILNALPEQGSMPQNPDDRIVTLVGTPAGASVSVDVAAVKADTAAIKAVTDVALTSADIQAAALAALVNNGIIVGTGTFTTSSATVPADTGQAAKPTKHFPGCLLVPLDGVVAFQARVINAFTTTSGVFTLRQPFTSAPGTVAYAVIAVGASVYEYVRINYGLQESADLEGATKAVSATSEQAAVDYNVSLTPAAQNADSRLVAYNLGLRVAFLVDSHTGTPGSIHFSVRKHVAGDLTDPILEDDISVAVSDAALACGSNQSIATLVAAGSLVLGTATSYDIRTWVDADTATISLIKLALAVGGKYGTHSTTGGEAANPVYLTHYGKIWLPIASTTRVASSGPTAGASSQKFCLIPSTSILSAAGENVAVMVANTTVPVIGLGTHALACASATATDLTYWNDGIIALEC